MLALEILWVGFGIYAFETIRASGTQSLFALKAPESVAYVDTSKGSLLRTVQDDALGTSAVYAKP